jgi:bacteriorhodopsin
MDFNLAHIHLLLNHFPTIGFGIGFALLVVGAIARNDEIKRASLVILFLIAVIAIPTYMSGPAALDKICDRVSGQVVCPPGLSLTLIQEHEDWAFLAFCVMEFTGFVAWLGLWQLRRNPKLSPANLSAVLLLGAIAFGMMSIAANKGGDTGH